MQSSHAKMRVRLGLRLRLYHVLSAVRTPDHRRTRIFAGGVHFYRRGVILKLGVLKGEA